MSQLPDARLEELSAELHAHRETLEGPAFADEAFGDVMPAMPLLHRLGQPFDDDVLRLLPAGQKQGRGALGTDECVFASVGVAAYVDPPVLLVFGPMDSMRAHRLTAPWDTRGVARPMGWGDSYSRDVIDRYSLPGAHDELYLAAYLATIFDGPAAFVSGAAPIRPDHLGVIRAVERLKEDHIKYSTPEARFTAPIELDEDILFAAFADVDALDGQPSSAAWRRTVAALRRRLGKRFFPMPRDIGTSDLRGEAARFVEAFLADEGVLG